MKKSHIDDGLFMINNLRIPSVKNITNQFNLP